MFQFNNDMCMYMTVLLTKFIFNLYSHIILVHINNYDVFYFIFNLDSMMLFILNYFQYLFVVCLLAGPTSVFLNVLLNNA